MGSKSALGFVLAPLAVSHIDSVVALQTLCFPPPFSPHLLWRPDDLVSHLSCFPAGQFVALSGTEVVGSASSLIVSETVWSAHSDWDTTCGGKGFLAHDPTGTTLYAADISVHPDWRGLGVARGLYERRFALVRQLGLARLGTACRVPGYRSWQKGNPDADCGEYCRAVVAGHVVDTTLTPLCKIGLGYVGVAENHMDDEESGNAAAVLEWRP